MTCLHEDQYTFFIISHLILLRMINVSNKSCRNNQTRYFMLKIMPFMRCCGKILKNQAGHTWQYNMACVQCMLDTKGYKYTPTICNTYRFSTATVVPWTHLSLMLYIHCLVVSHGIALVNSCSVKCIVIFTLHFDVEAEVAMWSSNLSTKLSHVLVQKFLSHSEAFIYTILHGVVLLENVIFTKVQGPSSHIMRLWSFVVKSCFSSVPPRNWT
jgi:hypothetical protein